MNIKLQRKMLRVVLAMAICMLAPLNAVNAMSFNNDIDIILKEGNGSMSLEKAEKIANLMSRVVKELKAPTTSSTVSVSETERNLLGQYEPLLSYIYLEYMDAFQAYYNASLKSKSATYSSRESYSSLEELQASSKNDNMKIDEFYRGMKNDLEHAKLNVINFAQDFDKKYKEFKNRSDALGLDTKTKERKEVEGYFDGLIDELKSFFK